MIVRCHRRHHRHLRQQGNAHIRGHHLSQGFKAGGAEAGFLDGAAYWPGGRNAFLDHFGIELDSVMARYDLVLHLESVAVSRPLLYGRANNGIRYEDVEGARRVESRVIEAWDGHPARIHVPAMDTVEDRVAVLLRELRRSVIDI
jgi:hypothetical protein